MNKPPTRWGIRRLELSFEAFDTNKVLVYLIDLAELAVLAFQDCITRAQPSTFWSLPALSSR